MYIILKQFVSQFLINGRRHEKITHGIVLKYLSVKFSEKASIKTGVLALNFSFDRSELKFAPTAILAITKISERVLDTSPFVENHFRKVAYFSSAREAKDYRRIEKA